MRLWQAILLLLPHVCDNGTAQDLALAFMEMLSKHDHPLSLRYLIEWALERLFLAFPTVAQAVLLPYVT